MRSPSPAFSFYPKDWLSDATVMAMSLEEQGAYVRLLSIYWLEDGLPSDVTRLARLAGVPLKRFQRLWVAVAPCFERDRPLPLRPTDKERRPHIPTHVRIAVLVRDGWACRFCNATERLELDHIIPFCFGGEDSEANLQTLCKPCNLKKGAN